MGWLDVEDSRQSVSLRVSGVAASGAGEAGSTHTARGHLVQGDITVKLRATASGT
jgi:hypothetical protein